MPFPIIEVPSDLEILSPVEDLYDVPEEVEKEKVVVEQQGTKSKFWFLNEEKNNYYLYKKARLNSGEDWSEKIASELCRLLKLPHASYDLAIYKGDCCSVEAYAKKCTSWLYSNTTNKRLKTFDVFRQVAQLYPNAAQIWLNLLEQVKNEDTLLLFEQVPNHRISATAIDFAQKILEINRDKLLEVRKEL